jgi:hypothetical protein
MMVWVPYSELSVVKGECRFCGDTTRWAGRAEWWFRRTGLLRREQACRACIESGRAPGPREQRPRLRDLDSVAEASTE